MRGIQGIFFDCRTRQGGELFIVEGRSAAEAVNNVRSKHHQAVFALRGKIPNCSTPAGLRRALNNEVIQSLLNVVLPVNDEEFFSKILILCDADADGLHARRLLSMFFQRYVTVLLERRCIFHVYPPLYQSLDRASGLIQAGWTRAGVADEGTAQITYFKGIASMPPDLLAHTCIAAGSRTDQLMETNSDL